VQCWCWSDGRVHNAEYRVGANEVRRSRRHVPDSQYVTYTAPVHGSVRGIITDISRFFSLLRSRRVEDYRNMINIFKQLRRTKIFLNFQIQIEVWKAV